VRARIGPPWGGPASARRDLAGCRGGQAAQEVRNRPADPVGRQLSGLERTLPGQALIGDEGARQPQAGVGQQRQPGPAVGLDGMAEAGQRPVQAAFEEAKGMFLGKAAHVGPPEDREVWCARARSPEPEHLRLAGVSGQAADFYQHDGAAHDRPLLIAAAARVRLRLGVQVVPGAHPHRAAVANLALCHGFAFMYSYITSLGVCGRNRAELSIERPSETSSPSPFRCCLRPTRFAAILSLT
jgi:hypothetical protein